MLVKAFRRSSPTNYPEECRILLEELRALTQGVDPQFWISNSQKIGSAFVDEYTLFPGIVIPNSPESEWTKENWYRISFGIVHLIRSMNKIPELLTVSSNTTKQDNQIAKDINQTVENFFVKKYLISKKIIPVDIEQDYTHEIKSFLNNINDDTLPALIKFRALQMNLKTILGYKKAHNAWKIINKKYHQLITNSQKVAIKIDRTAQFNDANSKALACHLVLDYLGFTKKQYQFLEYHISIGKIQQHDYNYYQRKKERDLEFHRDNVKDKTIFSFTLPFYIPADEGVYYTENYRVLLEHVPSFHPLASWETSGATNIESKYDKYGLYGFTKIQISLPIKLELKEEVTIPANDYHHEIYKSYPIIYYKIVSILNEILNFLKREEDTAVHTSPVNLLHLSQMSIQEFSSDRLIRNIPFKNNDVLLISFYKEHQNNIFKKIINVPLYIILTNEAKRHLIETDPRRAILDLYTAFESFINFELKTRIGDLSETTKDKFLRLYKKNISEDIYNKILSISDCQQKEDCPPTLFRIIQQYKNNGVEPKLNNNKVETLLNLSNLRNRAAHGDNIGFDKMNEISEGINALEDVIISFLSCKTA